MITGQAHAHGGMQKSGVVEILTNGQLVLGEVYYHLAMDAERRRATAEASVDDVNQRAVQETGTGKRIQRDGDDDAGQPTGDDYGSEGVYDEEEDEKNEDGYSDDNVTKNDDLTMLYIDSSDEEGSHSRVDELSSPTGSDSTSSKQTDAS